MMAKQKETLAELIARRVDETRADWQEVAEQNNNLPIERQRYGKFMAFKEIADFLRLKQLSKTQPNG